jgi:Fe-Mn family superoxide dismutase
MSTSLRNALERDFTSVQILRDRFIQEADAMFGPGFVWLVCEEKKVPAPQYPRGETKAKSFDTISRRFYILKTYSAGTPLQGQLSWRSQNHLRSNESLQEQSETLLSRIDDDAVLRVFPVLCVSTWEHSWIIDWGAGGKDQFLKAWWDRVNWNRVATLAESHIVPKENIKRVLPSQRDTSRQRLYDGQKSKGRDWQFGPSLAVN